LAVEHLNERGGILGRPVVADCIDDQSDPKQAVVVAHAICDDPDYVAVWGHGTSGTTIPAMPIYDECRMPLVAQGSNPQITTFGYDNVFQAVPNDLAQGNAAAEYIDELGAKTVSVTHNKTIFGEVLAEVFRARAEQLGLEILSFQGINPEDADHTPTLTKIKDENPDALYHAGYVVESAPLRKQMVALGMDQVFVASESTTSEFIATTGEAGVGTISSTAAVGFDASDALKEFAKAYEESWGLPPEPFCNYYYDAIFIIADAIERAGSTEHEAVIAALRETDYEGITMRYGFDEQGRLKNPVAFVFELKPSGQFELVKTWVGSYD
jgi:branched-chain amino acid transport system substrate-binding protein